MKIPKFSINMPTQKEIGVYICIKKHLYVECGVKKKCRAMFIGEKLTNYRIKDDDDYEIIISIESFKEHFMEITEYRNRQIEQIL